MSRASAELSVSEQLDHARSCVDHELGHRIRTGVECLAPPRHIDSQRKWKRRCFGVHPWPMRMDQSAEVLSDRPYHIGLRMEYGEEGVGGWPVETVWGGGGEQEMAVEGADLGLRFTRCGRSDVRSSATSGQIPFLFYM